MVNKLSYIKELLLCFWALKLNGLLWKNYPLPDSVQLDLLYISPPTCYLIHHQLSAHNRTSRCHPHPRQLIVPVSQVGNIRQYLAVACCSAVSFQLEACSMPPGLEGAPASVPAKTLTNAKPAPALAPEPGAAVTEVPLFSANWPVWPNGWGPHTAPGVRDETNQKYKNCLTLFWYEKVRQCWFNLCCKYTNISKWCC